MQISRIVLGLLALLLVFGCVASGPKDVSAKAVIGGINVSWQQTGSSAFNVYRSMTGGAVGDRINPSPIQGASYRDITVRDGNTYYYTVRSVDSGGNEGADSTQSSATAKTSPPDDLQISIDSDMKYTNSTSVTLALSADGATECRFSNDGQAWSDYEPYASQKSWTLPGGDGMKQVYYQCKDAVGNTAHPISASIYLDMTPPKISMSSPTTNGEYAGSFDLAFTVTDSSTEAITCSGTIDDTPIAIGAVDAGKEERMNIIAKSGAHTLTLSCSDGANTASQSVSFTVTDKPDVSLHIESGAGYTSSASVKLDVTAVAKECRFSNDGSIWGSFDAYVAVKSWTLTGGDGTKTVYCQCRSGSGVVSDTVSDTIVLDTSPPPYISIQINDGTSWTNSRDVSLGLYAFAAQTCHFSNDNGAFGPWEPYSRYKGWQLSYGEGMKYVNYECKDKNDKLVGSASASIRYSQIEPNPPSDLRIKINGGASYTTSRSVDLTLRAKGASECRFEEDDNGWTSWQDYDTDKSWTLSSGDGTKTIYYQCRNDYGKDEESATIYLQTAPPGRITDLAATIDADTIYLRWSRPTGGKVNGYHIYRSTQGLGLFTQVGTSYGTSYQDRNTVAGLTYSYSVRTVDYAGNEGQDSNIVSASVPDEGGVPSNG
jgi:hypothetical protein